MATSTGIGISEVTDLVTQTLKHFKRKGQFELEFDETEYHVVDRWFRADNIRVQDGQQVEWGVVMQDNGTARHTQLFSVRDFNYIDVTKRANAPWVLAEAVAIWEKHIMTMQRGSSALMDYMNTQLATAYLGLVREIDLRAFDAPESAATDALYPRGVPYWINFLTSGTTDYTGSFSGQTIVYGDGDTGTNPGGIDKAANPKARNWAANRRPNQALSIDDMRTVARGARRTRFTAPRDINAYWRSRQSRPVMYWSIEDQLAYEDLCNSGSDNRNGDLNPFHGKACTFRGIETIDLQQFDDLSHRPIYCLKTPHWFPIIHANWWFSETEPMNDREQPHVYTVQLDCQYQYGCDSPRKGGFCLHDPF